MDSLKQFAEARLFIGVAASAIVAAFFCPRCEWAEAGEQIAITPCAGHCMYGIPVLR